jgi:acyl transferase domain-containing protein/short-subunit dehydrogenase/acyl carrier protein
MSLELRNRLAARSGLRLPSTLVFDHPTPQALLRYLSNALSAEQTQPQAPRAASPLTAAEPIAIVGMSCRFPGGADTPEALWRVLRDGLDVIGEFPRDRGWDVDGLYDPDPEAKGKTTVARGGFLEGMADFDAAFFNISPREALAMDPQQRLLLETAWEALERASIDPRSLAGSATGVFIGLANNFYGAGASVEALEGYAAIGGASSVASGRISYTLGLEGPAVTLDTACSSSLVALHLAVQSLRQAECDLALVGAVTVLASPVIFIEFSRQRGLAPDGHCKAFSDAADGTSWSEGAGMLALRRLSDARRGDQPVLALVRGTAINQDGKSAGLTAPNGPAQERVIRQALSNARLSAGAIDVVEAHGTGTKLGDPIEAQALLATYGAERSPERPLLLGAVKTNLGHTQQAAGVAGVMKLVLALQHGVLPKNLHAGEPTRHVDWSAGTISLLTAAAPWQANGTPRRAAVSAFGISGTNAHVILEEAPAIALPASSVQIEPRPLLLSARTEPALRAQAARLHQHLIERPELPLADVAYTLASARTAFEVRAALVAEHREHVLDALARLAAGEHHGLWLTDRARSQGGLAVLFSGQGSQRAGMGRGLYAREPLFQRSLDATLAGFSPALGAALRQLLLGPDADPRLDQTQYAQPALFAFELALYRLFEASGLRADYVLGHSVGEIVAAHVAGVMSLPDACTLVEARGRLMQALPAGGAMAALQATEPELSQLMAAGLDVAAINALDSVVVSGDEAAVEQLVAAFQARGRKARRLSVSHAFHSARMEPMLAELEQVVRGLTLRAAELPIVSNVSGEISPPELHADPRYWVEHARQAVQFYAGVRALRAQGVDTFVELGPQAVLSALVHDALAAASDEALVVPCSRKDRAEHEAWLAALAALHCGGRTVAWRELSALAGGRAVPLPTYAFQRERYWVEAGPNAARDPAAIGQASAEHPLLHASVSLAEADGALFTGRLSLATQPWLSDCVVHGVPVFSAAGFVELALAAAQHLGAAGIEELRVLAPLVLPERGGVQLQLTASATDAAGARSFNIYARSEHTGASGAWTCHAQGTLAASQELCEPDGAPWEYPPAGAEAAPVDAMYEVLAARGLAYSGVFRSVQSVYRRADEWFARLTLPPAAPDAERYGLHPALLDGALHAAVASRDAALPERYRGISLGLKGARELHVHARLLADDELSLRLFDARGAALGSVASLQLKAASEHALRRAGAQGLPLFQLDWQPLLAAVTTPTRWASLGPAPALPGLAEPSCVFEDVPALRAALAAGVVFPALVFTAPRVSPSAGVIAAAHGASFELLELLRAWCAEPQLDAVRLMIMTSGALAVTPDEPITALPLAPLWGLVRAVQNEHPDYAIQIIDVEQAGASEAQAAALDMALSTLEPQLALRDGVLRVPRLAALRDQAGPTPDLTRGGVLITGGTGTLGGVLAEHLVRAHGARQLWLCSRSGRAEALRERLQALGATVRTVACDASSRAELQQLLAAMRAQAPIAAVFHAAGVVDDGVLAAQTPERFARVFGPKLDGAAHLHELTRDDRLRAFVLFSAMSGVVGVPGQSNYAAANTFLDALAQQRRARGLPALSLCWGLWEERSRITGQLTESDLERMARGGVLALKNDEAMALLDRALGSPHAQLVPSKLEVRALQSVPAERLPAALRGLVKRSVARAATASASEHGSQLRAQLAGLPANERMRELSGLVLGAVRAVLGARADAGVELERPLSELGLDSLMAVELRNQLAALTGLKLPSTLLFDHPTPQALARLIARELFEGHSASAADDELRALLASIPLARLKRSGLLDALVELAQAEPADPNPPDRGEAIDDMNLEALVQLVRDGTDEGSL